MNTYIEPTSIMLLLLGRLGDTVMALPTVRHLSRYHVGNISCLVYKPYADLLSGIPKITIITYREHYPHARPDHFLSTFSGSVYDKIYQAYAGAHEHTLWRRDRIHPLHIISKVCELDPASVEPNIAVQHSSDGEKWAATFQGNRKMIVLAGGRSMSSRDSEWPMHDRINAAKVFAKAGYLPVFLSGGEDDVIGCEFPHLLSPGPLATVALLNRADAYMGHDTGTTWLACASKVPHKRCLLSRLRERTGPVGFANVLRDSTVVDTYMDSAPIEEIAGRVIELLRQSRS